MYGWFTWLIAIANVELHRLPLGNQSLELKQNVLYKLVCSLNEHRIPPFNLTFSPIYGVVATRSLRNSSATVAIPFVNGFFRALRRGIYSTFDIGRECGSGNAHGCSQAVS